MSKLKSHEKVILANLIEKLTGNNSFKNEVSQNFISTIEDYLRTHKMNFNDYLQTIKTDQEKFKNFISLITIHTTSWFREIEHFDFLKQDVLLRVKNGQKKFKVWSAACSTGQEVYSLALIFESIKELYPDLDYSIYGSDIDSISISKAMNCVYDINELRKIPNSYHKWLLFSRSDQSQLEKQEFTVVDEVMNNCFFKIENLNNDYWSLELNCFDYIFCRNVLIYFKPQYVSELIVKLTKTLSSNGYLILGLCEIFNEKIFEIENVKSSIYQKKSELLTDNKLNVSKKRALIVDDYSIIRMPLREILSKNGFDVFEAQDAFEAQKIIENQKIDFISLDVDMPGKNGLDWLREIRSQGYSMPVVIVTGTNQSELEKLFGALDQGAQDFILKDNLFKNLNYYLEVAKVLSNKKFNDFKNKKLFIPQTFKMKDDQFAPQVILIGASTGGPETLFKVLQDLPKPSLPILIVQHINHSFISHFSERLAKRSGLNISGNKDQEYLAENTIYLSFGDYHLTVIEDETSGKLKIKHTLSSPVHYQRPSVDVLFKSLSLTNAHSIAILLTGMGADGALGMQSLFSKGTHLTIAQSEDSCVVFGMPQEALKLKCVHHIYNLEQIRLKIEEINNHAFRVNKKAV